eukprot:scaffold184659_cov18-Tisochrysis_lutea.AAC.1
MPAKRKGVGRHRGRCRQKAECVSIAATGLGGASLQTCVDCPAELGTVQGAQSFDHDCSSAPSYPIISHMLSLVHIDGDEMLLELASVCLIERPSCSASPVSHDPSEDCNDDNLIKHQLFRYRECILLCSVVNDAVYAGQQPLARWQRALREDPTVEQSALTQPVGPTN